MLIVCEVKMKTSVRLRRILFVVVILYWYALYVHVPIQTSHLYKLGVSAGAAGIIIGAYGFGQVLLRVPLGMHCDRSGRLFPYVLIGTAVGTLGAIFRLGVNSPRSFLVANILGGIAAAVWIAVLALFAQLFSQAELHRAMAYATTGHSTAMLTSSLSCAALVGRSGMRGVAAAEIVAGLLAFVLAVVAYRVYCREVHAAVTKVRPGGGSNESGADGVENVAPGSYGGDSGADLTYGAFWRTVKNVRLWQFAMLAFVHQGLILSLVMSFVANQAQVIGADEKEIAAATFLYWAVTVLVNALAGRALMVKLGAKFWLPVSLVLAAIYCLLLLRITAVWQLFLLQIMGGIFGGTVLPFSMSESLAEIPRSHRGTALGVYQAILAGGMVLLPSLSGALIQRLGTVGGFCFLSLAALAAAGYAYFITHQWSPGKVR